MEARQRAPIKSQPGYLSPLDLTSLPLSEISILNTFYEKIYTTYNVTGAELGTIVEFIVPPSNLYTDLFMDIHISGKLCNSKGEDHVATDGYAIANNFFHTFFESVDLEINNVLVEKTNQSYNYGSNFVRTLCTDYASKKTFYQKEGFYPNTKHDDFTSNNSGYQARKTLSALSTTIHLSGNVMHGLLESGKFLLPHTPIRLRMRRAIPTMYIDAPTVGAAKTFDSQFRIENIYMMVKRVLVLPSIQSNHENILNSGQRLLYPFVNREVVNFSIPSGVTTHLSENISVGPLPTSLIIGLTKTSKFFGTYNTTAMTFQAENLRDLRVLIDGEPIYPHALDLDTGKKNCIVPYTWSFAALEPNSTSHGLTLAEFINTSFLFLISLVPSGKLSSYHPLRTGSLRLDLVFKSATSESLTCIVCMQSNKCLQLDRYRSVYID